MYKHPNLRPSKEDIRIAEACLSRVPVGLLNEISTYRIHYTVSLNVMFISGKISTVKQLLLLKASLLIVTY